MGKLVTIFGGSGFVGRYIARRMAKEGWRVRVAVRRPNEALFVRPYGTPGQVEPVACNIRDDASVRAVIRGADAVVNCVGILNRSGKNTFDAVQAEGAGRIARITASEGVGQMVHISAIGADAQSDSAYSRTKAEGEAAVLAAFPGAVILAPLDHLRDRGRLLQPLRVNVPHGADPAGRGCEHPVPAGLCR
jgi:uncharacterized protein YbjT (DUF2867 family)